MIIMVIQGDLFGACGVNVGGRRVYSVSARKPERDHLEDLKSRLDDGINRYLANVENMVSSYQC
jgi:hypothetical protein